MNARRAKILRKVIYGDQSTKQKRKYIWDVGKEGSCGGIKATGLRREYQDDKRGI
jgi:hypothetical protein